MPFRPVKRRRSYRECQDNNEYLFRREKGPKRDVVLINSAAAFVVSGKAKDFAEGIRLAQEVIDSGLAMKKLNELREFTQKL